MYYSQMRHNKGDKDDEQCYVPSPASDNRESWKDDPPLNHSNRHVGEIYCGLCSFFESG